MNLPRSNYGTPYTVEEMRRASEQPMDEYHRDLMRWAVKEIEDLRVRVLEANERAAATR